MVRPGSPQLLDTLTEFILNGVEGLSTGFGLLGHRITLSALAKTLGGIVNPICLAVFKLIMNCNFVGRSTGRSPAFAPLRILSTRRAASWAICASLAP
jgi:hypothetical protein